MDTYCQLFLNAPPNKVPLVDRIAGWTGGIVDGFSVITAWGEIDVEDNEFFDEAKARELADGFLCFRYYLDVEKAANILPAVYVAGVADLLEKIWASGCRAVAACDFEDELPRNGGFSNGAIVK